MLQVLQPSSTSPPPQQHGQSGYTPGVVDYSLSNQSTSSQPNVIPSVPSPPPLQSHQFGYASGDGNYETRRSQPPLNPYVTQPSPSPQQHRYSGGGADYGAQTLSHQSTSSQLTAIPYVSSPPPLQEAGRSQRFSNPFVVHTSPSPEESRQGKGRGNHIPEGGVDRDDSPPGYTSMQN